MAIETFGSGSLTLDLALGGGYPRGRVVEVYGPESSGKTTLALHAVAEMQRLGGEKERSWQGGEYDMKSSLLKKMRRLF